MQIDAHPFTKDLYQNFTPHFLRSLPNQLGAYMLALYAYEGMEPSQLLRLLLQALDLNDHPTQVRFATLQLALQETPPLIQIQDI